MKLDEVLSTITKCDIPSLQNYSTLQKINTKEFYYPSPLRQIRSEIDSRVILFSAPGAVGKTALAKHIAYNYGGLYWNVALKPIGGTSFAGEITHAVGVGHGAQQDELYRRLKCGESLFILDSFDEAALISRRDGIKDFLSEIGEILSDATAPSIIMTARTEMAQFICDVCSEIGLKISCYEIDYFEELEASRFITEYLRFNKILLNPKQIKNIDAYINEIKQHLGAENNPRTFIGYAQVLSILARQVEVEYKTNSELEGLSALVQSKDNHWLIYDIIQELILREQRKLDQFKSSIRHKYIPINKEYVVDSLYCKQEQLIRLQFLVSTNSVDTIAIDDYTMCAELLPEDKPLYLELLKDWLPQHVFLCNNKVMPIFCDYLLAESLLNSDLEIFAEEYQAKLPTRVFMDCYLSLNDNCVKSEHIYYLDLAFSSQAETGSTAYCDIGCIGIDDESSDDNLTLYLTLTSDAPQKEFSLSIKIIRDMNSPICLCRAENMSVTVDGKVILAPSFLTDVTIRKSSIECDELELNAPEVIFETYGDEEKHLIVHDTITRQTGGKITVKGTKKLKVELPTEGLEQYKRTFYEFLRYLYAISADTENANCCDDIEQYVHALKKVLEQFKVDRYDGDPAKFKEKIDARCHTGCKSRVLAFLKAEGLIYEDGIMYKASLKKMDSMKISRVAYNHFDFKQLQYSYEIYQKWFSAQQFS